MEYVIENLENVSNMPGENMTRNDNDIFIRKTAENAIELIKEQQAEIARLKGITTWIDPEKQPPTPNDSIFGRYYIVRNKHGDVFALRYARRKIRGKYVERWQRDDMSVYNGEIVAYMDMPK